MNQFIKLLIQKDKYFKMKRIIREYDQKNKIISKIEQSLKKSKDHLPPNKSNHISISPAKQDYFLPQISNFFNLSPKKSQKKENQENFIQKNKKIGCVQTITFRSQVEQHPKNIILMNHRRPIKSIIKDSKRYGDPGIEKGFTEGDIFLSTQKYGSVNKFLPKKRSKYSSSISSMLEEITLPKQELFKKQEPERTQRKEKVTIKQPEKEIKNTSKQSSLIIERLAQKHRQHQPVYMATLSPRKFKNPQIRPEKPKYSPWTSEQSDEIHDLWSSQL